MNIVFFRVVKKMGRAPATAMLVLLFVMIMSAALCVLQKNNDAQLQKYDEMYHTLPITFSITNLSGTNSRNLGITWDIAEKFTAADGLGKYVSNLEKVCKYPIRGDLVGYQLVGITSLKLSPELFAENGTVINWKTGFGEDIFSGNELFCLIPDNMAVQTDEETAEEYVELTFGAMKNETYVTHLLKLRVIGTYKGSDDKKIYCPYTVCEQIYSQLGEFMVVQSMSATLKNNDDLEELREVSKQWFAQPNPLGEKTPYEGDEWLYSYYPFALSINDETLQDAAATLETNIKTNHICTVIVLTLSAAAGFLAGFLVIRSRKREIVLMRTMGMPNSFVYFEFALEQMLCVILGIGIGGSYNLWDPLGQLLILGGTYFLGLTIALILFLNKNLLTTIKEDE